MNIGISSMRELAHAVRVMVRSKLVRLGVVPDTIDPGFRTSRHVSAGIAAVDELEMLTRDHEVLQAKFHRAMSGWGSEIESHRCAREEFHTRSLADGDRISELLAALKVQSDERNRQLHKESEAMHGWNLAATSKQKAFEQIEMQAFRQSYPTRSDDERADALVTRLKHLQDRCAELEVAAQRRPTS